MAQSVKNLTTMQEIWVRTLGQEDPLEKERATHSSIFLPRKKCSYLENSMDRGAWKATIHGVTKVGHN